MKEFAGFRLGGKDRELMEIAAEREDLNLSEFVRRACLERARRVVLSGGDYQGVEHRA